jgi:hypothetical protein
VVVSSLSNLISPSRPLDSISVCLLTTCDSGVSDVGHLHKTLGLLLIDFSVGSSLFLHHQVVNIDSDILKGLPGFTPELLKFLIWHFGDSGRFLLKVLDLNVDVVSQGCKNLAVDTDIALTGHPLREFFLVAKVSDLNVIVGVCVQPVQISDLLLNPNVIHVFRDPLVDDLGSETGIMVDDLSKLIFFLLLDLTFEIMDMIFLEGALFLHLLDQVVVSNVDTSVLQLQLFHQDHHTILSVDLRVKFISDGGIP